MDESCACVACIFYQVERTAIWDSHIVPLSGSACEFAGSERSHAANVAHVKRITTVQNKEVICVCLLFQKSINN